MLDYYHFKEINDLFLKGRNEEAHHLLTEMQARYIAVCDENSLLRMQLSELEDVLFLAKNLFFDGECYWLTTGGIKQGPFCHQCYNNDGALIRLENRNDEWTCPVCDTVHERPLTERSKIPLARPVPATAKVIPFPR